MVGAETHKGLGQGLLQLLLLINRPLLEICIQISLTGSISLSLLRGVGSGGAKPTRTWPGSEAFLIIPSLRKAYKLRNSVVFQVDSTLWMDLFLSLDPPPIFGLDPLLQKRSGNGCSITKEGCLHRRSLASSAVAHFMIRFKPT